jgi:hypothetical protein
MGGFPGSWAIAEHAQNLLNGRTSGTRTTATADLR